MRCSNRRRSRSRQKPCIGGKGYVWRGRDPLKNASASMNHSCPSSQRWGVAGRCPAALIQCLIQVSKSSRRCGNASSHTFGVSSADIAHSYENTRGGDEITYAIALPVPDLLIRPLESQSCECSVFGGSSYVTRLTKCKKSMPHPLIATAVIRQHSGPADESCGSLDTAQ
jgi:hypothetical protein